MLLYSFAMRRNKEDVAATMKSFNLIIESIGINLVRSYLRSEHLHRKSPAPLLKRLKSLRDDLDSYLVEKANDGEKTS